MWGVYKDFILIDWFYDYFDAKFCSDQNQGSVIYFFFEQAPEKLYEQNFDKQRKKAFRKCPPIVEGT